jgi:AcrR family transcriptional regulator
MVVKIAGGGTDFGGPPRREQILEAARAAIEEHGPDALTGQIAQRAGLARPNVYRHFASKDELDLAVARSAYHELRTEVLARLAMSGTPLDVISAPITAQVAWADRHPNLYRFLVSRGYHRSFQPHKSERNEFATDLAAAGQHYFPHFADDPELAAVVVIALSGLIDASILAWLNRRTESREQLIDRLTDQAWLIVDYHLRSVGAEVDPAVPLRVMGRPQELMRARPAKPR